MGGFVENPELPEALDVSPENAFDIQSFAEQLSKTLKDQKVPAADTDSLSNAIADGLLKILHWSMKTNPMLAPFLLAPGADMETFLTNVVKVICSVLIKVAGGTVAPGMEILSGLTRQYVEQFVTSQTQIRRGEAGARPAGLQPAAAGMFDSILAPLAGLYGAKNPAESGAGEVNAQYSLGSIISLHLNTWAINILSNLTGLGVLKWINSFDDVITAAVNSRSLGRIALRPYLDKFMATPLRRDLNEKLPLEPGSASNLIKGYIRGALSREKLIRKMRGLGFAEEVVEDLLLDTAKLLSTEAVVWLVNQGQWTEGQATEHLEQAGWPKELAPVVFQLERTSLVRSQMRSLANSLVSAFQDRLIDNPTLRYLLGKMDLSQDEINAFVTRGAVLQELPKRLTYAQVRSLYQESLVDLSYVETFLRDEGYSDEDVDLLVLLEFTRLEERKARVAYQLEQRRIREEKQAKAEQAALAKQQAELLSLG